MSESGPIPFYAAAQLAAAKAEGWLQGMERAAKLCEEMAEQLATAGRRVHINMDGEAGAAEDLAEIIRLAASPLCREQDTPEGKESDHD